MIRRVICCTRSLTRCLKPILRYPAINTFRVVTQFSIKPPSSGSDNDKLKQQGNTRFQMEKIIELKKSEDFQQIMTSTPEAKVIYLYADENESYIKFTPKLEAKIKSLENIKLVRVNTTRCPQIAQALENKAIPSAHFLIEDEVLMIHSNVSDSEFDKFFSIIAKIINNQQTYLILEEARTCIKNKDIDKALVLLENIDVKNEEIIAMKELFLAQCYFSNKNVEKFKQAITRVSAYQDHLTHVPDFENIVKTLKKVLQKLENQSKKVNH